MADLSDAVDEALEMYDMERSERAEELGRMVAPLQD
jgi:hypothetical protein